MFCTKCGAKNDPKVKFCTNCGNKFNEEAALDTQIVTKTKTSNIKGLDIASMILGILGVLYAFTNLIDIADTSMMMSHRSISYLFGYGLGYNSIQFIFGILSLVFACNGRNNNKNGFNTAGFWLSISTFILIFLTLVCIFTY